MIVTIDGPCGSGKSTVARALARRMGFDYLDTGAMYRAVTWKALEEGVELDKDAESIKRVARGVRIDFKPGDDGLRVLCDGSDVTCAIRSPEVTRNIRYVADDPQVRDAMVRLQREYAQRHGGIVTEGRDQGSVVFPYADVRFYLDADVETRAARRAGDFRMQGFESDFERVMEDIRQRDMADRERPVGGLRCTDSMIVIDSTGMDVDDVVSRMEGLVHAERSGKR